MPTCSCRVCSVQWTLERGRGDYETIDFSEIHNNSSRQMAVVARLRVPFLYWIELFFYLAPLILLSSRKYNIFVRNYILCLG